MTTIKTNTVCSCFHRSTLGCEAGAVVVEFILAFPIAIFIILFLIGLGHTLITKQHALVAVRYISQYRIVNKQNPSSEQVTRAVASIKENWSLSVSEDVSEFDASGTLKSGAGGVLGSVLSFFSGILDSLIGNHNVLVTASTRPERGLLPRIFRLNFAQAAYIVEYDTWTCEGNKGSYVSIVSSEIRSQTSGIPLVSWVTNLIDRVIGGFSCCETYQSPKER